MATVTEQGSTAPETTHSPIDWAAKLRESTKTASNEDKRPLDPQAEESELEEQSEGDDPTEIEVQDTADEEELEADAEESDETEPSETEPQQVSIAADSVYLVDGEEIDGQTLLNGIAATKNFAQEKHRLREEAATVLHAETEQLHLKRDEYAQATSFMIGMNQQAQRNIQEQLNRTNDPQQFQALRQQQAQMQQASQQLHGQFDQFLGQVKKDQAEQQRKTARESQNILLDKFGGEDGWSKRYSELRNVAGESGFPANEFNQWTDHRLMSVFDEIGSLRKQVADMQSITKKKTASSVIEKNKRNSQRTNTLKPRAMSDARDKFSSSHKVKDAAAMWLQAKSGPKGR